MSPEQQRTELLQQIADMRAHLSRYPASCAARERREAAFEQLYMISASAFQQTPAQVDAAYRKLDAEDRTPKALSDELAALHQLWLDQLSGQEFYPQSRRGV